MVFLNSSNNRAIDVHNNTIIYKLFICFQSGEHSYDRWDRGISLYVRSGAEPRVGNVSRSLGRNTIIAPNDSIETLIDSVTRERPDAFVVSQIRCRVLITYEYLTDRTVLLEPDNY